jgi:hypothetical protein
MSFTPEILEGCPFTIENIPFGVISTTSNPVPHCATAIGEYALDLAAYFQHKDARNIPSSLKGIDFVTVFSKVGPSRGGKGRN